MSDAAVLAVDIGGTKTAAALIGRTGEILASASAPTPAQAGPEAIVDGVLDLAARVAAHGPMPSAAGIGTAGVVDVVRGRIISSTDSLARWAGTPVRELVADGLAARLGVRLPVHVQNDVDAHANGELRYGAARGADSALVIAVGTGIGGGVVIDGAVRRGAHHVAGEIAHVPTPGAEHLRCPCGRPGHLEAIGSGVGLYRHYAWLGGTAATDGRGVAALAQAGDQLAARAVHDSAAAIARGIVAAVTVLDPAVVVVTGSVAAAGPLWWTALRETFAAEAIDVLQSVPLVAGELGGDAALLGSAASAWDLVRSGPDSGTDSARGADGTDNARDADDRVPAPRTPDTEGDAR
ncbi:MAG: ROK family protein [Actinobacteria bacterium]|nr:ROK family protein [Actinomycetota bacterium]